MSVSRKRVIIKVFWVLNERKKSSLRVKSRFKNWARSRLKSHRLCSILRNRFLRVFRPTTKHAPGLFVRPFSNGTQRTGTWFHKNLYCYYIASVHGRSTSASPKAFEWKTFFFFLRRHHDSLNILRRRRRSPFGPDESAYACDVFACKTVTPDRPFHACITLSCAERARASSLFVLGSACYCLLFAAAHHDVRRRTQNYISTHAGVFEQRTGPVHAFRRYISTVNPRRLFYALPGARDRDFLVAEGNGILWNFVSTLITCTRTSPRVRSSRLGVIAIQSRGYTRERFITALIRQYHTIINMSSFSMLFLNRFHRANWFVVVFLHQCMTAW